MKVRTLVADHVLLATAEGDLDIPAALSLYGGLVRYWLSTRTRDILMDCTRLVGTLPPLERYEVGVRLAESYHAIRETGTAPPRIAVVAVPPLFDRGMFLQTVAANRGVQLRAFTELGEAAEWLGVDAEKLRGEGDPLPA